MHVGPSTGSCEIPPNAPVTNPAPIRNPEAHATDNLDGICTVRVTQDYVWSRSEYMDVIRNLYSRDKGRLLLNEVARIGREHDVYPVLGSTNSPQDRTAGRSLSAEDYVRQAKSAVRMENGACIWNPLFLPFNERSCELMEISLAELCRQLGSTIPEYAPDVNLQPLMAPQGELDPSVPGGATPESVECPYTFNGRTYTFKDGLYTLYEDVMYPRRLDIWEGETALVTLLGKLQIRLSTDLQQCEVARVLEEITEGKTGHSLLRQFCTFAEKNKILIVAKSDKQSGLTKTADGSLVLLFNKSDWQQRCLRAELWDEQLHVYSAFADLLMAWDYFRKELRLPPPRLSTVELANRFHREIKSPDYYELWEPEDTARSVNSGHPSDPTAPSAASAESVQRPLYIVGGAGGGQPGLPFAERDVGDTLEATSSNARPKRGIRKWFANVVRFFRPGSGATAIAPPPRNPESEHLALVSAAGPFHTIRNDNAAAPRQ